MGRDEIIRVIKDFSGTINEEGVWKGDPLVAPLIARLYRAKSELMSGLDEEGCKKEIVGEVKQLTRVNIPEKYDPDFWNSRRGKRVINKLDKKLPVLPEVRKDTKRR